MFDIETYLSVLGYTGPADVTLQTLRDLHKRHLMNVPYDSVLNSGRGIELWEHVDIDVDTTFDEIIAGSRGGVCTELNGLFRVLLEKLGFDVSVLSAGTRQLDGSFGPDLEHVFNLVRLDGLMWLVDVGFVGPSYLEPLQLNDKIQYQYGNQFVLTERDGYRVLHRKGQQGDFQAVYRFKLTPRTFAEWQVPSDELRDFARELAKAGTLVRGRAFEDGQRILIGRRFVTVESGHDQLRVLIDKAEYQKIVADILRLEEGDRR
jgi:amide synthase